MATNLSNIAAFLDDDVPSQESVKVGDPITRIREEAEKLGITKVPLDIRQIVERLFGIKIVETNLGKHSSGFLERVGAGWTICVNNCLSEPRKRFALARELGQFVYCQTEYAVKGTSEPEPLCFRLDSLDPTEPQANEFALELLMPKEEVQKLISNGFNTVEALSDKFQLPNSAIKERAFNLGYSYSLTRNE